MSIGICSKSKGVHLHIQCSVLETLEKNATIATEMAIWIPTFVKPVIIARDTFRMDLSQIYVFAELRKIQNQKLTPWQREW